MQVFLSEHFKYIMHYFQACRDSAEKSANSLMGILLNMTHCLYLAAFRILSLTFTILIMTCLGVSLFEFIFFDTLCASCTWYLFQPSFHQTHFQPSSLFFSWNLYSLFFSWDLYNVNVSRLDVVPKAPIKLFSFLFVIFLFASLKRPDWEQQGNQRNCRR